MIRRGPHCRIESLAVLTDEMDSQSFFQPRWVLKREPVVSCLQALQWSIFIISTLKSLIDTDSPKRKTEQQIGSQVRL